MEALRPSLVGDDDGSIAGITSSSNRQSHATSSSSAHCASSSLDDALSFMSSFDLRFDSAAIATGDQFTRSAGSRTQANQPPQTPPTASASATTTTTPKTPRPRGRPRVAHGVKPSAGRPQEQTRPRSAIGTLRGQVKELQARRSELQTKRPVLHSSGHVGMSAGSTASTATAASSSSPMPTACASMHANAAMWLNQAVHQYEQLQQTEAITENLRETLAKQIELRQLLDAQVQEHAALLPLSPAHTERGSPLLCRAVTSTPRVTQGCPFIRIEQLHKNVASVRRGIDAVLQQFGPLSDLATSIFQSSQTKNDPTRGPVFELKSSAPVPSSVCDLARLLWKILGVTERASDDVEMVDEPAAGPNPSPRGSNDDDANNDATPAATAAAKPEDSHEKWYNMKLQTQFGEVAVEGASVLCRYVEAQRVAFAFASSIAVADSDMVFRESGWFVLAESEPPSSLFQTFYQLHPQHPTPTSTPTPMVAAAATASASKTSADCAYLQDLVMSALGNRMRLHHQQLQSLLLKGAASKPLPPPLSRHSRSAPRIIS